MHDPDVVVFDIHAPIPRLAPKWYKKLPRTGIRRVRGTGPGNLGKPIYPWYRPQGYNVTIIDNSVKLLELATVWHHEPGGKDSGQVCGHLPSGSDITWPNIRWAWQHRDHIRIQWQLGRSFWRWYVQRCDECGHRFRRKEARFGTGWNSGAVMHHACSSVRHLRGQRDDALNVAMGIADSNAEFRVRYLLEGVADKLATESIKKALDGER